MLSIPDMALLGAAALLLFGPEQLPRVARKAGNVMREIQNTSQSFIRELERAADLQDAAAAPPPAPAYDPVPYDAAAYDGKPYDHTSYDETPYEMKPFDDAPTQAMHAVQAPGTPPEPPAVDDVSERLAEPRPALDLIPPDATPSRPAQAAPQGDHPAHL
jgi:sec-independent protein translocase protein TatA